MSDSSTNRTLVIIVAAAVVGVVGILLALDAVSRPEPVTPTFDDADRVSTPVTRDAPEPGAAPDQPVAEPQRPSAEPELALAKEADGDPPHSPLLDGPQPEVIEKTWGRIREGLKISVEDQKRLYDFGKDNPNDARPQLLLAYDSMNREWHGIGIRMYRIAWEADPVAKEDPSMLTNLVWVAGKYRLQEHREAVASIKDIYGGSALPAIDEAITQAEASGKLDIVERLETLRGDLQ